MAGRSTSGSTRRKLARRREFPASCVASARRSKLECGRLPDWERYILPVRLSRLIPGWAGELTHAARRDCCYLLVVGVVIGSAAGATVAGAGPPITGYGFDAGAIAAFAGLYWQSQRPAT